MNKKMLCIECHKEITDRTDLTVANKKFILRPFHKKCFKEHVENKRKEATMFFDAMPVNGTYGTVMSIIFLLLIAFLYFFYEVNELLYIICLIFPLYRIMSWVIFERRLN